MFDTRSQFVRLTPFQSSQVKHTDYIVMNITQACMRADIRKQCCNFFKSEFESAHAHINASGLLLLLCIHIAILY